VVYLYPDLPDIRGDRLEVDMLIEDGLSGAFDKIGL
jgi:hypothetical protein